MTQHNPGTLTLLLALVLAVPARAQSADDAADDLDALWGRYDAQATRFEELHAECEAGDRATTLVNRICREAADASLALADTIERLLEVDDALSDDDRELLIDGMLTNRQIGGALWVDLGECASGRAVLVDLLDAPGVAVRPVVRQATENWIARADQCLGVTEEPVARRSRVGPIVTMSTGLAILVAGVAWDLAEGGNRREFDRLNDDCRDGCGADDYDRLVAVRDDLERAGAPIAVLYASGAAVAVGGAIWLAVAGRDRDPEDVRVSLAPRIGRASAGAVLDLAW